MNAVRSRLLTENDIKNFEQTMFVIVVEFIVMKNASHHGNQVIIVIKYCIDLLNLTLSCDYAENTPQILFLSFVYAIEWCQA